MPSVAVSVFIVTWYLAYGLYILGCLMGGESSCKGKGQATARRRRAYLYYTKDTETQGKTCNDFPTPKRRVRERSSWFQLVGVGKTHLRIIFFMRTKYWHTLFRQILFGKFV